MRKFIFLFFLLFGVLFIVGCSSRGDDASVGVCDVEVKEEDCGFDKEVVIYKSPTCGCCVGHAGELKKQGFNVETINTENIGSIKAKYNIPRAMESCHTSLVGGYFVEGHVPIDAINKLLEERPDIDGIALPGMPAGSPGMPGAKQGPFKIYSLKDGVISEFMDF